MTALEELTKRSIPRLSKPQKQFLRVASCWQMVKKDETNDIVQYLIPTLEKVGIKHEYCKIDVTTEKSGNLRGDIWVSLSKFQDKDFEKNIIGLIEAKHRKTIVGDIDWRDAMRQGKEKARNQKLNYYIVTNCISEFRFYNSHTDEEIVVDGTIVTKLLTVEVLQKIQSQISAENCQVIHKSVTITAPISPAKFRETLKSLANIYRSVGLKQGEERIDPTVSFVVLKYISEAELEQRTLDKNIKLWDELRKIANDEEVGDLRVAFDSMKSMIWDDESQYKDNAYKDFKDLINFPTKIKNEHCKKIYHELDKYHFHGANFDLFGAIYEEFASQTVKEEFGEFYTRRHITGVVARLLLRNETNPREMKICDPACGSGGFLTEAFTTLLRNYSMSGKYNDDIKRTLKQEIFWGYDNDKKSVARTKLNMFLVGDGHIHIYEIDDSLCGWNASIGYSAEQFQYVLTNPPMGKYEGDADIISFQFTNKKRYELLFVERVVNITKYGGEIAIVVNDGALEAPTIKNFRKKLLENCDIYAIISLTRFAFAPYTKEKTYVMFMQKKQKDNVGTIQSFPIWHFILDYDGYANSDKRFITKYHDDIPELEDNFNEAVKLSLISVNDYNKFQNERSNFERTVNEREKSEGLTGSKYGYVEMKDVNENNFYNLISEFHLRPYIAKPITDKQIESSISELNEKLKNISINL
jgi:type I restriction enzyme M protein